MLVTRSGIHACSTRNALARWPSNCVGTTLAFLRGRLVIVATIVGTMALWAVPAWAANSPLPQDSPAACQGLKTLANDHLDISTARWVDAGPLPAKVTGVGPFLAFLKHVRLPAHCLVRGVVDPRVGVAGVKYGLGFELRMPKHWNGRFLFQGGGGFDGAVWPAVGLVPAGKAVPLVRGFAVISSDGGHEGQSAAFASDQQAKLDYAYAGLGPVAELGQRLVAHYYGEPAKDSYFAGCSNGGREAMMVAERFPTLFNGIIAGDPGFNLSRAAIADIWNIKHFEAIAPKNALGAAILSEALTDSDLRLVSHAVLKVCDSLDGLRDGMINNVAACAKTFNLKALACKSRASTHCLSEAKVKALEDVFGGPHDSSGLPLYATFPFDAGIGAPGWRVWMLGTSPSAVPNALDATLGLEAMRYYFMTPPDQNVTPQTFDFNRALRLTAQTRAINDATGTFFSSFIAKGGKLIIYQGMSDPIFSANAIIGWYRELVSQYHRPQKWARLFLVPGMNHCGGGPATDQFDALTAIVKWTEEGKAPARIMAHGAAFPKITRPLCPYPKYARYRGGNPALETSFVCVKRS